MVSGLLITMGFIIAGLALPANVLAETSKEKTQATKVEEGPKIPTESYNYPLNTVWEKALLVVEKHEIQIKRAKKKDKKKTGKIKTNGKRYFNIISARFPPVQLDYRDSYIIKLIEEEGVVQVSIKRKVEIYNDEERKWIVSPEKDKIGVTAKTLFEDLKQLLAEPK